MMKKQSNKNIKVKEFFKPTLWKIILTAIIFVLILIILGTPKVILPECTPTACGAFLYFLGLNINVSRMSGEVISLIFLIIYSAEIMVSYLISCLIIFIKKFRSEK